jgi:hypothetical protein
MQLNFNVFYPLCIRVGLKIGNCNATLIVFMDCGWSIGGNYTDFVEKLTEQENLAREIRESSVFSFTGRQQNNWLFLGLPRYQMSVE